MLVKFLIVEDDINLAINIKQMLAAVGYSNVSIARDYFRGLSLFKDENPDIIIINIKMNSINCGIHFIRDTKKIKEASMIFLSDPLDDKKLGELIEFSPDSYLVKPISLSQLMASVQRIIYSTNKMESFNQITPKPSKRENQIIRCIANGFSSREIAELLKISFETVQTHRKRIFKKYDIHSSAEVILLAQRNNWL